MATNNPTRWVGSLTGATEPLIIRALFEAGATQAIKVGEILEFTADTNAAFCPLDSDFSMAADIAIANEEIKSGDRAGYYEVMLPRPGDIFRFPLATATASVLGAALYYSDSETVTTSGTYILGYVVGQEHYPQRQGHLSDDAAGDAGTTIRSATYVDMVFTEAASYYLLLQAT